MIRTVTRDRDRDLDVLGDEVAVWPSLCCPFLSEGEERLAVDLVCSDKVDDYGDICYVQQPKGVVEAEAG